MMDSELNELHALLQKLVGLHRQLLETIRLEREALAQADLRRIQETTHAKEAIVDAIQERERQRLSWMERMRERGGSASTLQDLVHEVQAADQKAAESLRSLQLTLKLLLQRIVEANAENGELVKKSLMHLEQMKRNVLGTQQGTPETYGPGGKRVPQSVQGSRLISKEV
jgi:hypothetical protein